MNHLKNILKDKTKSIIIKVRFKKSKLDSKNDEFRTILYRITIILFSYKITLKSSKNISKINSLFSIKIRIFVKEKFSSKFADQQICQIANTVTFLKIQFYDLKKSNTCSKVFNLFLSFS